jgi:hypothetical protein
MSRNLDCRCLCHGSDGNRIGDEYFSCKGCYSANHMNALPRHTPQHRTKPAAKGPRKPRLPRLEVKEGLVVGKDLTLNTKAAAKKIMNDIADAAQSISKQEIVDAVQ